MSDEKLTIKVTSVLHGDTFVTPDGVEHAIAEAVILVIANDGTEKRLPLYQRFGGWWTAR